MNKWIKILIGLILVAGPLAVILPGMPFAGWGKATIEFLKASAVIILILAGLISIVIGLSEIKE